MRCQLFNNICRTVFTLCCVTIFFSPENVDAGAGKNFEQTAMNRIAIVLVIFVVFSTMLEIGLEKITEYFEHQHRHGMVEVIEKIKEEFLLVGVLSLLLSVMEDNVFAICMSKPWAFLTPATHCPSIYPVNTGNATSSAGSSSRRMLLAEASSSAAAAGPQCEGTNESYDRVIDVNALHQVHLLIFWLAVGHVIASFVTYYVARFTVQRWANWEEKLIKDLKEETDRIVWKPKKGASQYATNNKCRNHLFGWSVVFCGMDSHTLLSLRRFYISRHNLTPKFKIFDMVMEDLEHDFSDVAGIRFWMWLALCAQLLTNGTQSKVSGYYNWSNTFGTMLLAAHLRNIAEELSSKIWSHFEKSESSPSTSSDISHIKNDIEVVNTHFEDQLNEIEPIFICQRPKLLMYWFQLVQWNSSQTITQGLWFSSSGLGCYAYVRGPVVIAVAMVIACISLVVMGYTVLPTYALMLHCGEHLRPKGKTHGHREAKKAELHKSRIFKDLSKSILSSLKKQQLSTVKLDDGTSQVEATSTVEKNVQMTPSFKVPESASKYAVEVSSN
jgi:hypothetical protein